MRLAWALRVTSGAVLVAGVVSAALLADDGTPGRGIIAVAAGVIVALYLYAGAALLEAGRTPVIEEEPNRRPRGDDCAVAPASPVLLLSRRRGGPDPRRSRDAR
jgi:hypothetical protein